MLTMRTFVCFLLVAIVILLAVMLMPRGAAEDLPPLEILSPEQGLRTNSTTLMVTGMTAPNATVNVTVESHYANRSFTGSAKENGTFSVVVELYEGLQKVVVTVTDAQNRSSTATRDIFCDVDPPRIKITEPPISPFFTNKMSYTIVVLQLCECQIWVSIGGVEVPNPGVARRTVDLIEGENLIEVRARDQVWNEVVLWVVIVVDVTSPQLHLAGSAGTGLVTNSTTVTPGGNVSGAGTVVVVLNGTSRAATLTGGDWLTGGTWECPLDLGTADGTWLATVEATDAVGNVAKLVINITLDRTAPDILLEHVTTTRVPRVQINGTTEEGVDEVLIDGDTLSVVNGLFSTIVPLEHGWNRIEVRFHDPAGNWATRLAEAFYSGRPPRLQLDGPVRLGDTRVRIRGSSDGYVDHVLVNGRPFPVVNGSCEVVLNLTRGNNEFEVSVEDPAGVGADERVEVRNGIPAPGVLAPAIAMVLVAILARSHRGLAHAPRTRPLH